MMAHDLNIDGKASMMFVGQVPWHGLGTRLETAPATAAETMKAATVHKSQGSEFSVVFVVLPQGTR